jgi:hypothetical protein
MTDNPAQRTTTQRLNRAAPFRRDERMEHLAELREQHPDRFAALPPSQQIALGLYESDRANHAAITGGDAA